MELIICSLRIDSYDVALLYLEQAGYDLEAAVTAYKDDEKWEKEHPMKSNITGNGKKSHIIGKRRFTGQRH
jgi:hypothetical protein